MADSDCYIVIMAGGAGTRFWPQSRKATPKQFETIIGKGSMFSQTLERVLPLAPRGLIVVTNLVQMDIARRQMEALGIKVKTDPDEMESGDALLVGEPKGRNTAPVVALTAALVSRKSPSSPIIVMPSDHYIPDGDVFRSDIRTAENIASKGYLVTLGILPHRPETGYGYIKKGIGRVDNAFEVDSFHEKPDLKTALQYLESGLYLWNAGIFIWRADIIWEEMQTYIPSLADAMNPIREPSGLIPLDRIMPAIYDSIEPESIDRGVLEKSKRIMVLPANFSWSDVGSWTSLWELTEKDEHGNSMADNLVALDSENNLVLTKKDLVAMIGVKDMVLVETSDVIFLCKKDLSQKVRDLLEIIKKRGLKEYL